MRMSFKNEGEKKNFSHIQNPNILVEADWHEKKCQRNSFGQKKNDLRWKSGATWKNAEDQKW